MSDLPTANMNVADILPLLEISKIEEVFYHPNGPPRTQAEVAELCCGTFDNNFCPGGVAELYDSRNIAKLKGYTHIKLQVFPTYIELPWSGLADNTFTVTANKPWFIQGYISSFFSINKTSGGAGNTFVTVTAKSANTGELPRHASFTVVCGSKEITILISQNFEQEPLIHE